MTLRELIERVTKGEWMAAGKVQDVGKPGDIHKLWCGRVETDGKFRGDICTIQSCEHIEGIDAQEAEANAAFIALARNTYSDLVAALECISTDKREHGDDDDALVIRCQQTAEAALAALDAKLRARA